jgi:fumarate reductase subunit C
MAEKSKLLHRKMSATWWLHKPSYRVFMLREFSAVFLAIVALGTILQVQALKAGSYSEIERALESPFALVFGVIALAFTVLHSVTFFQAAGKVFVFRVGDMRVSQGAIVGSHFAAWISLSAVVGWLVVL